MTIERAAARRFAELLRTAEAAGTAAPLATETFPGIDWDGARR